MVLGEEESVLFREVSVFQGCPCRGVPMYNYDMHMHTLTTTPYTIAASLPLRQLQESGGLNILNHVHVSIIICSPPILDSGMVLYMC